MSKGPDWKRAMLNEAEASGNEVWARETRKVAKGPNLWANAIGLAILSAEILHVAGLAFGELWWLAFVLLCIACFVVGTQGKIELYGEHRFGYFGALSFCLLLLPNFAGWPTENFVQAGAVALLPTLALALGGWQKGGRAVSTVLGNAK